MKKLIVLLFVVITIANQGCKKVKECPECFTPPGNFTFELVNKATGENLFTNGTFQPKEIEIINTADSSDVNFDFIDEDDVNVIVIKNIGWVTEKIQYEFTVSGKLIFRLYVDAERVTDDNCCSYTKYNEIKIEDVEYEYNSDKGVCKILVER